MNRGFAHLASARLVSGLGTALALILVARNTTVHDFGILALSISILGVGHTLIQLGLPTYTLREITHGRPVRALAALKLSLYICAALLLASPAFIALPTWRLSLMLIGLHAAFALERLTELYVSVCVGEGRHAKAGTLISGRALFHLLLFLLTAKYYDSYLSTYVWTRALAAVIFLGLGSKPFLHALSTRASPLRRVIHFSNANALATIRQLDTALVGLAIGPAQAGLFAAVSRITSPILMIAGAASTMILASTTVRSENGAIRRANRIFRIGIISTLLLLPTYYICRPLLVWIFGEPYAEASLALYFTVLGVPSLVGTQLFMSTLQGLGREREAARTAMIYVPLALGLMTLASIVSGITGAAVALTIVTWVRFLTHTRQIHTSTGSTSA